MLLQHLLNYNVHKAHFYKSLSSTSLRNPVTTPHRQLFYTEFLSALSEP